jgi:hypothetical protein
MEQEQREKQFDIGIPTLDGWQWSFEFECTFKRLDAQQVVVEWHDTTMGSGSFTIRDCSPIWLQDFKAYSILHTMALNKAYEWNVEEQGRVSRDL